MILLLRKPQKQKELLGVLYLKVPGNIKQKQKSKPPPVLTQYGKKLRVFQKLRQKAKRSFCIAKSVPHEVCKKDHLTCHKTGGIPVSVHITKDLVTFSV